MTSETTGGPSPVRFRRLAEQVADDLRRRILLGDLGDGAELPVEGLLREQYPVSKPTLREAMRVLEAEGLVTVRRGSIGGAVVHRPHTTNVAYTLGLVLAAQKVNISEVATALREVEPACAASCAERRDRSETVVPRLREIHQQATEVVGDLVAVTTASRQFHEAIVELCGNEPLRIMAGALEALWSTHESDWAHRMGEVAAIPTAERLDALEEHSSLIDLIEAGDAETARRSAATHLLTSQTYPESTPGVRVIDPDAVRASFVARTAASAAHTETGPR
ncbi:FCD domain-containing protein [Iamia majanohamensis]|uniref:FCD domain-containing protein n=1 Tax=Iamia majanohamensis TaxID=467976 RepID=A0AAE9YB03_9ACTN|nr:FCD domain-containing protein [Iamia majanohamensis]WCO67818.1 FCD domain-containing protein [Iamia majanohamensis]